MRVAKDACAFGVVLRVNAACLAWVALGDEQTIHDALRQRFAPIDFDIEAQKPVAFGLAVEHP